MSKSILEKIYDKIDKLEKDKQDYLEAGKMTTVNKKKDISKMEGILMIGLYMVYIVYVVIR